MDPTDFMNLSRRGASLWTRFITVSRAPRHVAAHDWLGYFFILFKKKNQTKKNKNDNNKLCCFGNRAPPPQVSLMGML